MSEENKEENNTTTTPNILINKNLPYGWTEETDGEIIFYKSNTGETQDQRPKLPCFAVTYNDKASTAEWSKLWDSRSTTRQPECIRPGNWYYYNNFTTEGTEEKPPLFTKQSNGKQPKYLIAIVLLQNFIRQTQGRKRVRVQRAKKIAEHAGSHLRWEKVIDPGLKIPYWYDLHGGANNEESAVAGDTIRWDEPEISDMYDYSLPAELLSNVPKYTKLWDPRTHSHYYFNNWEGTSQFDVPTDWIPEMITDTRKSPILNATMQLQCVFRRRQMETRMRKARDARENMSVADRQKEVARRAEELVRKEQIAAERRKKERERSELNAMRRAELEQCNKGDTFWGIDFLQHAREHAKELERRMKEAEEKKKLDAENEKKEAIERRKKMSSKRKEEMKLERQRNRELIAEEKAQCNIDRFWGVDKAEKDRRKRMLEMENEDIQSRKREESDRLKALQDGWYREYLAEKRAKDLNSARHQVHTREGYLADFYSARSSDRVLDYRWPLTTFVDHLPNKWHSSGFSMKEVYDTARIDAPASVFHDLNAIQSAPPRAARDFLLSVESKKNFNLLPHMHKITDKTGIPPEIDAREIASRQRTASASLCATSHLEWMELTGKTIEPPAIELPEVSLETRPGRLKKINRTSNNNNNNSNNDNELSENSKSILDEFSGGLTGMRSNKSTARRSNNNKKRSTKKSNTKRKNPNSIFRKKTKKKGLYGKARRIYEAELEKQKVKFTEVQRERFRYIFSLIDEDKSGHVDQHELMTSLRINDEVISFVKKSPLLQPLLRDRDLQRTFMAMDTDGEGGITFEEFEAFLLSNATVQIVEEDERVFQEEMRKEQEMKNKKQHDQDLEEESIGRNINLSMKKSNEDALLEKIFNLIDVNGIGKVGKEEFIFAWKSIPDVKKLSQKSQTLGPLSKRHGFTKALLELNTENSDSMTFDEFHNFCHVGFVNKKK